MTFIVPGCVQYTVHGTHGGRNIANVLAFHVDSTGGKDRGSSCFDLGGALINAWVAQILPNLASTYATQSVSWLDLDTATGNVGSRTSTSTVTLPQAGTQLTAAMPGSVSFLVRKSLAAQRGARNGRMYLCGVPEVVTDTAAINNVTPGNVTAINVKLAAFFGAVNKVHDPEPAPSYSSTLSVIHITSREPKQPGQAVGNPLTGVLHDVSSLTLDSVLATQRKRLRG